MSAPHPSPTACDEELAAQARAGSEAAFALLFGRYTEQLQIRLLNRMSPELRRKVSVQDVLQETFAAAWRSLGGFEPRGVGSFAAWLTSILDARMRDTYRRYSRMKRDIRREKPLPSSSAMAKVPGHGPSPSAEAVAHELSGRLEVAVGNLPDHYRKILHLVMVERCSMSEAGARIGKSADAAQKIYQRARAQLWAQCNGGGRH